MVHFIPRCDECRPSLAKVSLFLRPAAQCFFATYAAKDYVESDIFMSHASGVSSPSLSLLHFGPHCNISTTVGWIAM